MSGRLVAVEIDSASIAPAAGHVALEQASAIDDLLAENAFALVGRAAGDTRLRLAIADGRLVLDISDAASTPIVRHMLSLTPLSRVIRDYWLVVDSHYAAVRNAAPAQIEAIDMGRRGLHNEGAEILRDRLAAKVAVDFPTARRLFTLVAVLTRRA